jgi:hypothetical protein
MKQSLRKLAYFTELNTANRLMIFPNLKNLSAITFSDVFLLVENTSGEPLCYLQGLSEKKKPKIEIRQMKQLEWKVVILVSHTGFGILDLLFNLHIMVITT